MTSTQVSGEDHEHHRRADRRSLTISQHLLGTDEIILIHHTDCRRNHLLGVGTPSFP
jgi:carbonic anhydrase